MVQQRQGAVSVAPEGGEGQSSAAHLVTLIYIAVALQQNFQSLRVAMVCLRHTHTPRTVIRVVYSITSTVLLFN